MANTDVYTGYHKTSFADLGTGRVLHPLAYLILLLIGFAFLRDDILHSPYFAHFRMVGFAAAGACARRS